QGDGTRPPTIAEDLSRYPVGSAVERYASHTGTVAVSKDQEEFASASLSYLFNPHNDATIVPIADDSGDTWRGGDPAAWLVITRDGTEYRYGTSDASSLWRDEGTSNARKVAWFLDQVTDSHGNVMRYYYETFPAGQDVYRQPVLRAIEYGIPASNVGISERLVVLFEHIESPWKRFSYSLGTRTDFAFLVDEVCVHARARVLPDTTPGGHQNWYVPDVSDTDPDINQVACWEL